MVIWLWCVAMAFAQGPQTGLEDPWARLAVARGLVQDESASADEAAVALLRLTTDDAVGANALDELFDLAVTEGAHTGWRDLYDALLSSRALSPDAQVVLATRAARARASEPGTRAEAIAALKALQKQYPKRTDVGLALADALLAAGEVGPARVQYQRADASGRGTEGLVLALLAANRIEEAREYATASLASDHPLRKAARNGRLGARVQALVAAGHLELARSRLLAEDAKAAEVDASEILAEALLARGDARLAAEVLGRLVRADGGRNAVRRQWVAALLEAGEVAGAKAAAGTHEASAQAVYAVELLTGGLDNASERASEIARAHQLAPDLPVVVRHKVALLLAQERSREAQKVLLPTLQARPRDGTLQQLHDQVALALQTPEQVLAAHRERLAVSTPSDFWPRIGALAGAHTLVAEHHKQAKRFDQARAHYQTALALQPQMAGYYAGIGGVLWASGQLDAAQRAYLVAHRRAPGDVASFESAVRIALAQGEVARAEELLASSRLRSPVVRKLQEDVAVAKLLQGITDALRDGLETDVRSAFQDLLVRFPDNPRILHALGDTLMRHGKPADAHKVYSRARVLDPANHWLTLAVAQAELDLERPDDAQLTLDDVPTGEDEHLDAALRTARARALRASGDRLHEDMGRDEEAFEAYSQSLQLAVDTWTLSSLAGLYLAHAQPSVALAFYDAAIEADHGNRAAKLGRITALQQLGRLPAARTALEDLGRRGAGVDVWQIQDSMEIQQALQDVDHWVLKGDLRRARQQLDQVASRHPESPHVDAAMGSLMLVQGQAGMALQRAERALLVDPKHGRALAVAMDAGLQLSRMNDVVRLMEGALDAGGGEPARVALENALFASRVETAVQLAKDGRRRQAEQELADLQDAVSDNPDHWALLGGGYLEMDLAARALEIYDRSLEREPEHVPSLIGRASAREALGSPGEAARLLADAYEEVSDARIGIALAQVQGRLGRFKQAKSTLQEVREGDRTTRAASERRFGRIEPLPVVPLPSGVVPEDQGPLVSGALAGRVSKSEIDALDAELSSNHYPYGDVGGGFVGRTGTVGENLLNSAVMGAALGDFYAGPFRLQADVLSVLVDNGGAEEIGVSAAIGVRSPAHSRIGFDVRVGTSPLGFTIGNYLTWLGQLTASVGPHVTVGADTGRAPVTDSLLSWAGTTDEATGTRFGMASSTWGGGWISMNNPNLTDGGVRFRAGFVDALGMERNGRQQIDAWGGQSIGDEVVTIRIGGNFAWIANDRQIDGFEVGGAGVFSPRSYTVGLVRGDVDWTPSIGGTQVCATGAVGVQSMTGEASPYFQPGVFRAFEMGAGLRLPLADAWKVGLDAKNQSMGNVWSQTTVVFRIGHVPGWTGRRSYADVSPIHGTGLSGSMVCGP
ncbi:MAG: BCSC C-terminal domain-containing protein [Myxococcales bacterium]|nr:BCSC C-terminal domain-containing protein [Myxococcales bacterium]